MLQEEKEQVRRTVENVTKRVLADEISTVAEKMKKAIDSSNKAALKKIETDLIKMIDDKIKAVEARIPNSATTTNE